MLAKNE
ncbi:aldo/keto reductase family protein, partial [Yersinia pestis PY-66]